MTKTYLSHALSLNFITLCAAICHVLVGIGTVMPNRGDRAFALLVCFAALLASIAPIQAVREAAILPLRLMALAAVIAGAAFGYLRFLSFGGTG